MTDVTCLKFGIFNRQFKLHIVYFVFSSWGPTFGPCRPSGNHSQFEPPRLLQKIIELFKCKIIADLLVLLSRAALAGQADKHKLEHMHMRVSFVSVWLLAHGQNI